MCLSSVAEDVFSAVSVTLHDVPTVELDEDAALDEVCPVVRVFVRVVSLADVVKGVSPVDVVKVVFPVDVVLVYVGLVEVVVHVVVVLPAGVFVQ